MERMARGLQTAAGWPWCLLKSSSPAQELPGDVVWLMLLHQHSWVRRGGGGLVASTGSWMQRFSTEGRAVRAEFERKGKNCSRSWRKIIAEGNLALRLPEAM